MKPIINKVSHATVSETELLETKLVIFGNPQIGTPILQAAPLAGLDALTDAAVGR